MVKKCSVVCIRKEGNVRYLAPMTDSVPFLVSEEVRWVSGTVCRVGRSTWRYSINQMPLGFDVVTWLRVVYDIQCS